MVLDSLFNYGIDYLKQTSEDIGKYVDSYSIHHVKRTREINSFCSASNSLLMQAARIAKMLMAAGNGACGSKRKRTGRVLRPLRYPIQRFVHQPMSCMLSVKEGVVD